MENIKKKKKNVRQLSLQFVKTVYCNYQDKNSLIMEPVIDLLLGGTKGGELIAAYNYFRVGRSQGQLSQTLSAVKDAKIQGNGHNLQPWEF